MSLHRCKCCGGATDCPPEDCNFCDVGWFRCYGGLIDPEEIVGVCWGSMTLGTGRTELYFREAGFNPIDGAYSFEVRMIAVGPAESPDFPGADPENLCLSLEQVWVNGVLTSDNTTTREMCGPLPLRAYNLQQEALDSVCALNGGLGRQCTFTFLPNKWSGIARTSCTYDDGSSFSRTFISVVTPASGDRCEGFPPPVTDPCDDPTRPGCPGEDLFVALPVCDGVANPLPPVAVRRADVLALGLTPLTVYSEVHTVARGTVATDAGPASGCWVLVRARADASLPVLAVTGAVTGVLADLCAAAECQILGTPVLAQPCDPEDIWGPVGVVLTEPAAYVRARDNAGRERCFAATSLDGSGDPLATVLSTHETCADCLAEPPPYYLARDCSTPNRYRIVQRGPNVQPGRSVRPISSSAGNCWEVLDQAAQPPAYPDLGPVKVFPDCDACIGDDPPFPEPPRPDPIGNGGTRSYLPLW